MNAVTPPTAANKKVLLVDGNSSRRRHRVDALCKHGVDVICAADVVEARLLWHPNTYALVLLDARHDPAPAVEFCSEIKSSNGGQLTAFLVGKSAYLATTSPVGLAATRAGSDGDESMAQLITHACEGVPHRGRFQEVIWRMSLLRSSKPAQVDTRPYLPVRVEAPETAAAALPPMSFGEAIRQVEIEQEGTASEAE